MAEGVEVHVAMAGFERELDFDKKKVREAMRKIGVLIRRDARKDVGRKAIPGRPYQGSVEGEFPRKLTGRLRKSINYKVSRPGFLVMIRPQPKSIPGDFYPAFLHYGVTGKPRRKDHKAQEKDGMWRIAPRKNYMVEVLKRHEGTIKTTLHKALVAALKIL